MPKVKICDPGALKGPNGNSGDPAKKRRPPAKKNKQLEDKLIEMFGMSLQMVDLLKVLGLNNRACAKRWVQENGIVPIEINGRQRFLATEVAQALERSKLRAV